MKDVHWDEEDGKEGTNTRTVEVTAVGSVSLHHAGLHHHHPHICKNRAFGPDICLSVNTQGYSTEMTGRWYRRVNG